MFSLFHTQTSRVKSVVMPRSCVGVFVVNVTSTDVGKWRRTKENPNRFLMLMPPFSRDNRWESEIRFGRHHWRHHRNQALRQRALESEIEIPFLLWQTLNCDINVVRFSFVVAFVRSIVMLKRLLLYRICMQHSFVVRVLEQRPWDETGYDLSSWTTYYLWIATRLLER